MSHAGVVMSETELKHLLTSVERIDSRLHETTLRLEEKLDSHNQVLLRNTITLEEHVRRTNLLEDRVDHIEKDMVGVLGHFKKDEWFQSSVSRVFATFAGFITLICTVLTAWYTLSK